jgi:hypothetical protein
LIRANVIPTVTIRITTLCAGAGVYIVVVNQPSPQVRIPRNIPAYKIFLAATMLGGLWKSGVGGMCSMVLWDKVRKIFHPPSLSLFLGI